MAYFFNPKKRACTRQQIIHLKNVSCDVKEGKYYFRNIILSAWILKNNCLLKCNL